jgi:uncharacterized membrane protein YkoI
MKQLTIHLAIVLGAAALASTAMATTHPSSFKGHQLAGRASVSLDQARVTALKARPGRITDQELEKEKGGSGLRYSFDIRSAGHTYEVGVDAVTGAVLEDGAEGKNPD